MTTPARRQYLRIKKEHPDEVLLFRMGDFYETFDDDARTVAKELEIALTSREMGKGQRVPLAGIPYHALDPYLARLIRKGFRVAICEQVSDPATSKGIVDREVVRVVSPGTVVEDSLLEQKANNYLAAAVVRGEEIGLAYIDISTAEFATSQFPVAHLPVELSRVEPSELLVPEDQETIPIEGQATVTAMGAESFHEEWARQTLLDHFGVASLEAYGCDRLPLAVSAAGAIIEYLGRNQCQSLTQVTSLFTYSTSTYMILDTQTRRNLEIFAGGRWSDPDLSLFSVLDRTRTPMGGRLLRRWLGQPLLDLNELERRQESVTWFHRSALRRERVTVHLDAVSDMERLVGRIRGYGATPRDLIGLARSLEAAPRIRGILAEDDDRAQVEWLAHGLGDHSEVVTLIRTAIDEHSSSSVGDGTVIRPGFSPELDSVRDAARDAQLYIARLERQERERTGIRSLKVGYNKVFGYYIEVSKPNLVRVPDEYVRRQTLVGGERFITPEMKEYESRILSAQDRIAELESALFRQVCSQVGDLAAPILAAADSMAHIDVFASLGEVALSQRYTRPSLDGKDVLEIRQGRHPVVEKALPPGGFVPNDTRLSNVDDQLVILTGPNMAGKSTYIRQVAIITLMAQIGSFVPAEAATIGVVDRIFTRVGLQDDVAVGQSTFMVEMLETAAILNHATPRSLIVLDEIGRGTSTYDGLSIARAVAEHVHNHPRLGCKTLFATHYHELTHLANTLPRARNFSVSVSEDRGVVVFLYRIVPGGADRSYGIHVAQLAGLPGSVINRAWEVLQELENGASTGSGRRGRRPKTPPQEQLRLIGAAPNAFQELLSLDVSAITPLEAINKLYELQASARDSSEG